MKTLLVGALAGLLAASSGPPAGIGMEEFGLSGRELVRRAEHVEASIAACMRENGFEYVAADYQTIRRGMSADKRLPGLSEEEFIERHGFGVATLYTGRAPQLTQGYSPARVGLGERNVEIFRALSPADRTAYLRTLLGGNANATFAVALETEDFSRTGGCTRQAIEEAFEPEQLEATYYNPKDAFIAADPRMKAALRRYAEEMREEGFAYASPDDVENDIRRRLDAISNGQTTPVEEMTAEQRAALRELRDLERRVAVLDFRLAEEIVDPVEERVEREYFSGDGLP